MKYRKRDGKKVPAAIFAAFFTIGLIETFLPHLDWQINSSFSNEYYLRIIIFIGLLFIASLYVLFSLIKAGNTRPWHSGRFFISPPTGKMSFILPTFCLFIVTWIAIMLFKSIGSS